MFGRFVRIDESEDDFRKPRIHPSRRRPGAELFDKDDLVVLRVEQKNPRNAPATVKKLARVDGAHAAVEAFVLYVKPVDAEKTLKKDFTQKDGVFLKRHGLQKNSLGSDNPYYPL
jgi:hypothetical protein